MSLEQLQRAHRRYLQSRGWRDRRARVVWRSNLKCERCGLRFVDPRGLDVHHKTYARVGAERAADGRARAAQALHDARFDGWTPRHAMREVTNTDIRHRVQGRQRLEQRLQRLRLQVARFQRHRATRPEEHAWAARLADALDHLLADPPGWRP